MVPTPTQESPAATLGSYEYETIDPRIRIHNRLTMPTSREGHTATDRQHRWSGTQFRHGLEEAERSVVRVAAVCRWNAATSVGSTNQESTRDAYVFCLCIAKTHDESARMSRHAAPSRRDLSRRPATRESRSSSSSTSIFGTPRGRPYPSTGPASAPATDRDGPKAASTRSRTTCPGGRGPPAPAPRAGRPVAHRPLVPRGRLVVAGRPRRGVHQIAVRVVSAHSWALRPSGAAQVPPGGS